MKKGTFKNPVIEHLGDAINQEKESLHARSSNIQNPGGASQNLNPAGTEAVIEKRVIRQPKKQEPPKAPDSTHTKLVASIREIFLEIRDKTINDSPDCALILRKRIPFEEPEERILTADPIILLHHIKKIFDKVLELKSEAEKEAALRNENECGDYEGMLQKLEAEIRQHVRVEQELKLIVESIQSKLEDQEKDGDTSKLENVKSEVQNLKQENLGLNEKMKHCRDEISNLKKRMQKKVEMVEKLEKRLENIPVLKKIVREMDKVLDGEPTTFSIQESAPLGSQRSSKDLENQSYSNAALSGNDIKARKRSQPIVVAHNQERNRDSNEYIRVIDASVQFSEEPGQKRESFGKGKSQKDSGLKQEGSLIKSTARLEDKKVHDLEEALRKPRKSAKGESNRQNSRDKQRPDQEGSSSGDHNIKDIKAIVNLKVKEDRRSPPRFGGDPAFKAGMEEYLKKSFEKQSGDKAKGKSGITGTTKKNKTHVLDNSKDRIEAVKAPSRKNSASKPMRPSTTAERARHHEHTQHSPEQHHHTPDIYTGKESVKEAISNKRHDRSQSVEARKKLNRQHKSRASINDEESEENHRKQVSISGHYKGPGYLRVNQSGSGTFIKGHS